MIEIINELGAANAALCAALDRYLGAFSALQACCIQDDVIKSAPWGLSNLVTDELLFISSYETRVKQAKAAISLLRNHCSDIVPIHTLPNEILGRIFHLLHDAQHCDAPHPPTRDATILGRQYPDLLLHVCSRWRRVAIGLHALWSHVDISAPISSSEGFFERAKAFATRASFLDLHISYSDSTSDDQHDYAILVPFLASVATRIRSLNLTTDLSVENFHRSVLRTCFAYCSPGILNELIISDYGGPRRVAGEHIEDSEHPDNPGDALLSLVPQKHLEDLWFPIKILKLNGRCFPWTSKAYHGLVHLRLTSKPSTRTKITEYQLVNILKASPELRSFHFEHKLTDPLPEDTRIDPIVLKDIELLAWGCSYSGANNFGIFLRWVAPGSRPLQVSIRVPHRNESILCADEIQNFFARSNVTKLHVQGWERTLITELLCKLPSLQALAANHVTLGLPNGAMPDPSELSPSFGPCFETLYLLRCTVALDELRWLVNRHSVRSLTLWACNVYSDTDSRLWGRSSLKREEISELLFAVCPVVKSINFAKSYPIGDWYSL